MRESDEPGFEDEEQNEDNNENEVEDRSLFTEGLTPVYAPWIVDVPQPALSTFAAESK